MKDLIKQETLAQESDATEKARALVIVTAEDYKAADAAQMALQNLEKSIKADFSESKKAAGAAHKALCAQEAGHLEKVEAARNIYKVKMREWRAEQERLAAEETKRLQSLSHKMAEDQAVEQAAEAEKNGDAGMANAILTAPLSVVPVVVSAAIPKTSTRLTENWTYRVINEALLPREYMEPSHKRLQAQAKATHAAVSVAGVEFYDSNSVNVAGGGKK